MTTEKNVEELKVVKTEQDQLIHEEYVAPAPVEKFIDSVTGEVIDKSKLTHWQKIKIAAEATGTQVREPKSGCKKCFGRGYDIYLQDGTPHPCNCIYPNKTEAEKMKDQSLSSFAVNRKMKRDAMKENKNLSNKLANLIREGKIKIKKELEKDVPEIVKENLEVTPDASEVIEVCK